MSSASGGTQRRGGLLSRSDVPSLVLAGVLVAMGVVLAVDASGIESPLGAGGVGPAAFPWGVSAALLVLGVVLGVVATRGRPGPGGLGEVLPEQVGAHAPLPSAPDVAPAEPPGLPEVPIGSDRPPVVRADPRLRVGLFVAGLVAHALLIGTAGYVVAALVLFVAVALAFGAPRLVRTLVIGTVLTLVIFYSFTIGLGLGLPNFGGR